MKHRFTYFLLGYDGNGQQWKTEGEVEPEGRTITEAIDMALSQSFMMLTEGKASFGQPGKGGCKGTLHGDQRTHCQA